MTNYSSIKIAIVVGSPRANSESLRIANHFNSEYLSNAATIIDLHASVLPQWDGSSPNATVKEVKAKAAEADAFIVIAPEWNGMAPAALKSFFLWCGAVELAHKPALLVAVSSGVGGAMVISELRASSYKNARILYLPEHLIFRDVTNLWKGTGASNEYLGKRTAYALEQLLSYSTALKPSRADLIAGLSDYPNGMS